MFEITPTLSLAAEELAFTYVRSGGPGGQNVNKVSSKVTLRWNPALNTSLPIDVRARFLSQQRSKLTKEGDLLITSQKTRDQLRNTEDCLEKFAGCGSSPRCNRPRCVAPLKPDVRIQGATADRQENARTAKKGTPPRQASAGITSQM